MKDTAHKSIGLIMLLILLVALFVSCGFPVYESNGERIFFTATSSSGKPISSRGFYVMMRQRIVCANCHGPNGHGGTVFMMMARFEVPNITWAELTGPHEDHEPYTEETIKQAITKGIEPNGEELEYYMPRWQMADEDLNDLIDFLRTLK